MDFCNEVGLKPVQSLAILCIEAIYLHKLIMGRRDWLNEILGS